MDRDNEGMLEEQRRWGGANTQHPAYTDNQLLWMETVITGAYEVLGGMLGTLGVHQGDIPRNEIEALAEQLPPGVGAGAE